MADLFTKTPKPWELPIKLPQAQADAIIAQDKDDDRNSLGKLYYKRLRNTLQKWSDAGNTDWHTQSVADILTLTDLFPLQLNRSNINYALIKQKLGRYAEAAPPAPTMTPTAQAKLAEVHEHIAFIHSNLNDTLARLHLITSLLPKPTV